MITGRTARNIIRGRQNKAAGEHFEELLSHALSFYAEEGIAVIKKTPEPLKPIKSLGGGKFMAVFTKKSQVDFSGTLSGGRAIRFEAKQTDTERFARERLSEEQMDDLEMHSKLGAYCCVMLCFGFDRVYRIPWVCWKDMKVAFGHNYVTESDVKAFRVPKRCNAAMILDATEMEDIFA